MLSTGQAPAMEDRTLNDEEDARDHVEDLEMELDGAQEKLWEQSMSTIINEMRLQLQLDLGG